MRKRARVVLFVAGDEFRAHFAGLTLTSPTLAGFGSVIEIQLGPDTEVTYEPFEELLAARPPCSDCDGRARVKGDRFGVGQVLLDDTSEVDTGTPTERPCPRCKGLKVEFAEFWIRHT